MDLLNDNCVLPIQPLTDFQLSDNNYNDKDNDNDNDNDNCNDKENGNNNDNRYLNTEQIWYSDGSKMV